MEKFSAWRDKGTGISPFMPVDSPKSALRKYVADPLLVALKLPIFVVLYYAAFLAPKVVVRFVLFTLLGFSDIDVLVEGVRKLKVDEINRSRPSVNNVVIQNFVSPLDVFLLFYVSNVTSLRSIVVVIPRGDGLYTFSVWEALSLNFEELESHALGTKLADYSALKGKLVVLFPEGTASNNRAVLKFASVPQSLFDMPGFTTKTMAVRLYPNSAALPVPHLTKLQYLRKLLTSSGSYAKIKIIPHAKGSLALAKLAFADNGLNSVDLGLEQKKKFYAYYKDYALANFAK